MIANKNEKVSVGAKLLLYFFLVSVVPLLVLSITSAIFINSILDERINANIQLEVEKIIQNINKSDEQIKSKIDKLFQSPMMQSFDIDNLNQYSVYINQFAEQEDLSFISYFDKDRALRKTWFNQVNDSDIYISKDSIELGRFAVNDFIQSSETLVTINLVKLSDLEVLGVKFNNQNGQRAYILLNLISIPLYDVQTATVKGYVVCGKPVDINNILGYFKSDYQQKYLAIFYENFLLQSSGNNLETDFNDKILNLVGFSKEISGNIFSQNHWYKYSTIRYPYTSLPNNLYMLVMVQIDDYIGLKEKIRNLIIQISLLVGFSGILVALSLSNSITKPIRELSAAIGEIREGHLKTLNNTTDSYEINNLYNAFNAMTQTLQNRDKQISDYNKLLLNQKTKLESIIKYSQDGIITIDKDYKITSLNPALERWANITEAEAVEKFLWEIVYFSPYDFKTEVLKQNSGGDQFENLHEAKILDVSVDINYSIIYTDIEEDTRASQEILGYVLIVRDVTERKELEIIKENFVATLTHDLRVPILACVNTLGYFAKGSYGVLTEDQIYVVKQLAKSNKDLLNMVNNILDTYKYEAGKHNLVKGKVNIVRLINESIEEIKSLAQERDQNISGPTDNEVYVQVDKVEIKRVIINLLSNAIYHTPQGGEIEFEIEVTDDLVKLSVLDHGPGIPENEFGNLFKKYSRGAKTLRKVGSGLGLYLSKQIVEAHGGSIFAESKVKEGSCFGFLLPLKGKKVEVTHV